MERENLLDYLEADVAQLFELARSQRGALSTLVPACAPMTVEDLVRHLGRVYAGVRRWMLDGRRPLDWPAEPAGTDVVEWATSAAHELIDVMLPRRAAMPCATWFAADRTNGFWFRRMAHETAIHLVDVAQALGAPWEIHPTLATDGINESLEVWLGTQLGSAIGGSGRTVGLITPERDWLVRPTETVIDYPVGGPTDAQVEGEVDAVLAWIWGRADPAHPVRITGDDTAAAELRELFARAQQ